jgi:hypothetical protein
MPVQKYVVKNPRQKRTPPDSGDNGENGNDNGNGNGEGGSTGNGEGDGDSNKDSSGENFGGRFFEHVNDGENFLLDIIAVDYL